MVPLKPNKMIEREIELAAKGTASYMGREERDCLRRAAAAEAAFRAAKGYEPDTLWRRLRRRLKRKKGGSQ
ncbi:hypothetical protein D1159_03435 [Pseudoflavonifractor sp. 524-17]|uniref:hypothetical protein n=1 Tax=Pseudoflavonifractor sp. 524-17 TaxID=2304577 RepID=UPI0013798EA4|nr:hypothetical protein [Pseudoflavonifractor sp. 524-17]NCE63655.1 hypothetical protein [Pseudoflavonifractor sp. 524-17]